MPYITLDVELEDIYSDLTEREKQYLIDWLREDGYLNKRDTEYVEPNSVMQDLFEKHVVRIKSSYHQLSNEDIAAIEAIAKKY